VLVWPVPGGIVGHGGEARLGQEDAQKGMLEAVGLAGRLDTERVVGGEEAGPGVAGIAEELGQGFRVPIDVQGERHLGGDPVFGRPVGGHQVCAKNFPTHGAGNS
jgi:hypothetical protein